MGVAFFKRLLQGRGEFFRGSSCLDTSVHFQRQFQAPIEHVCGPSFAFISFFDPLGAPYESFSITSNLIWLEPNLFKVTLEPFKQRIKVNRGPSQ